MRAYVQFPHGHQCPLRGDLLSAHATGKHFSRSFNSLLVHAIDIDRWQVRQMPDTQCLVAPSGKQILTVRRDGQGVNRPVVAGEYGHLLQVWYAEHMDNPREIGGCDIPAVCGERIRLEPRETHCKTYDLIVFVEPENWELVFLAHPLHVLHVL